MDEHDPEARPLQLQHVADRLQGELGDEFASIVVLATGDGLVVEVNRPKQPPRRPAARSRRVRDVERRVAGLIAEVMPHAISSVLVTGLDPA